MQVTVLVEQSGKLVAMHQIPADHSAVATMVAQRGQQIHVMETDALIDAHITKNFATLHQSLRVQLVAGKPTFQIVT